MIDSMRRFCLVGVRGVGKTTLVRSVSARLPHVDYIVGSTILRELAGPEFAAFDALPTVRKEYFREEVIRWMERRQERERRPLVCDGHVTLLNPVTGLIEEVFTDLDKQFYTDLLLLDAPVDIVLARRRGDTSKIRNLDPIKLSEEIRAERATCEKLAAEHGMRLNVFSSSGNSSAEAWLVEALSS